MRPIDRITQSRPLRGLLVLVVLAYAVYIVQAYQAGYDRAARGETPLFTDFTTFYGASLVLRDNAPEYVYHPQVISEANRAGGNAAYGGRLSAAQSDGIVGRWMYPPTFIVAALGLAHLPYLLALFGWLLLTALPYLRAAYLMFDRAGLAIVAALAFPAVFYNAMFGQTGFLIAGLIGLGLWHLPTRPLWAGVLIGLASVKPHLGLLIPLVLIAGGHWRAFAAAAATVAGMVLTSIVAFGIEPWYAFIGTSTVHITGFEHGAFAWRTMISGLSATYLLSGDLGRAWGVQAAIAAITAIITLIVWWRGNGKATPAAVQAAALCAAIPLVTPMIYVYDLVIAGVAVLFLVRDFFDRGASRAELVLLALALLGQLLIKPLGALPGVPLAVLSLIVVFALSVRRALAGRSTAAA